MTSESFGQQINRLAEAFGKGAYSNERVKIIWQKVEHYSPVWFEHLVSQFISSFRQAPLPADFDEHVSRERERHWKREKEVYAKEAKEFMAGKYAPEDKKMIVDTICKRLTGGIDDANWSSFLDMLGTDGAAE